MRILRRAPLALVPALAALALAPVAPQAVADPTPPAPVTEPAPRAVTRLATDEGTGGAVTSVDPEATRIGLKVLESGGNAVDAAVATAAALGVTEPFSAGIGGGGYLMRLDGRTGKVLTIDGRESAPSRSPKRTMFLDPATGDPYPFYPDLVTSGLAVGTPGTVATWQEALERWGSRSMRTLLRPAAELARDGFEVDRTFAEQVEANADRFAQIGSTAALFLPDGQAPAVGSTFRNPGLAKTYDQIGRQGAKAFYRGRIARNIVRTVKAPPVLDGDLPVPPGHLREKDLKTYDVRVRKPLTLDYRGFEVHGMGSSSSGGSTVGQALAILERMPLSSWTDERVQHAVLEASALAFADRAAYVGDRDFVKVPDEALLDPEYADERLCAVSMAQATPNRGRGRGPREHRDHAPGRHRPLGHRRVLHADHRADRWRRHRGARSRLPAQQRAHRLQPHLEASRPQPRRARQAPAQLDGAHHRHREGQAAGGAGLARWLHHHHHGARAAGRLHRPRGDARGRHRRPARHPAQHGVGRRRAGLARGVAR